MAFVRNCTKSQNILKSTVRYSQICNWRTNNGNFSPSAGVYQHYRYFSSTEGNEKDYNYNGGMKKKHEYKKEYNQGVNPQEGKEISYKGGMKKNYEYKREYNQSLNQIMQEWGADFAAKNSPEQYKVGTLNAPDKQKRTHGKKKNSQKYSKKYGEPQRKMEQITTVPLYNDNYETNNSSVVIDEDYGDNSRLVINSIEETNPRMYAFETNPKMQLLDTNPKMEILESDAEIEIVESEPRVEIIDIGNVREDSPEWSEVFGTMGEDKEVFELQTERSYRDDRNEIDESEKPYIRLSEFNRKNRPVWYGMQIEKLAKQGKIKEAIDMLEVKMLKEDRVKPNQYVFTTLIGALGRVGYTKKAFSLFNKMKKFGLDPEDPTYTALFNACSNSPWKEDGLKRANDLRLLMLEKDYQPNSLTYKSMIKAYGMCGDLQTAFAIADECQSIHGRLEDDIFSNLLIACCSDKEAGFRYAIEVWRRMRKKGITPSSTHYNLLLRSIRFCGVGDPDMANQLLRHRDTPRQLQLEAAKVGKSRDSISEENSQTARKKMLTLNAQFFDDSPPIETEDKESYYKSKPIHNVGNNGFVELDETLTERDTYKNTAFESGALILADKEEDLPLKIPNMLNPNARYPNVVCLGSLETPTERLDLLGGVDGFLSHMVKDGAPPDIKVFSQLVAIIPSTTDAEENLITLMKNHQVEPDVDFFNILIKKKNLRRDFEGAKNVVELIVENGLVPDVYTFGCLALGCKREQDGMQLLEDMQNMGLMPNAEICGTLAYKSNMNFSYKLKICKLMENHNILPNEMFLNHIEKQIAKGRHLMIKEEKGDDVPPFVKKEHFKRGYKFFMLYYKDWLTRMEIDLAAHPWEKFRTEGSEASNEVRETAV